MSKRHAFSNAYLDEMIRVSGDPRFTRNLPDGEIARAFPHYVNADGEVFVSRPGDSTEGLRRCVIPARESNAGRGQPVFDLYHPEMLVHGVAGLTMPALWSFKISQEDRNPRNAPVTTGKAEHLLGVVAACRGGTEVPMICLNYNATDDQWFQLEVNVAEVCRRFEPMAATGAHGQPLVLSVKRALSGGRYKVYHTLRVNFAPLVKLGLTEGWMPVDTPAVPSEVRL